MVELELQSEGKSMCRGTRTLVDVIETLVNLSSCLDIHVSVSSELVASLSDDEKRSCSSLKSDCHIDHKINMCMYG